MATTGHENEPVNVNGLKAALQKLKTEHVDVKAAKATTLNGYGITNAYTKQEVNELVNVLGCSFVFEENAQATSSTPPSVTASSGTTRYIYLVGPQTGTKYEWITVVDESTTPSTYSWQQIDTTDINLSIATEQSVRGIVTGYMTSS